MSSLLVDVEFEALTMPEASNASSGPTDPRRQPAPTDDAEGPGDFLGPLLHTLAESLDVREIFTRISIEARRIVPHALDPRWHASCKWWGAVPPQPIGDDHAP